jgi:protein-disulfide isomerase
VSLDPPVDPGRDHIRGTGTVDLVEYGDFECPYCADAVPSLHRVLQRLDGRARLVFRHLPVVSRHPHAQLAAEAAEAAAAQGRFWAMHDLLFANRRSLEEEDLLGYAARLELDVGRFADDLRSGRFAGRVAEDADGGRAAGVSGTPAFFVAGERHRGFYDVESLVDALEDAGA